MGDKDGEKAKEKEKEREEGEINSDDDKDKKKKKKDKDKDRDDSRSRSRSRSRGRRGRSPDWARYKGGMDSSAVDALREKAREEAVCGHGKSYAKRPTTVEGEMWRGSGGETRVSMLGSS